MSQLIPPIYCTGKYKLKAPFTVDENVNYTCHAIRSYDDCVKRGFNVFEGVYKPVGLVEADYVKDKAEEAELITLIASGRPPIYVPSSYILAYPNMGEEAPQHLVVTIDLGYVTGNWDETNLLKVLEEVASDEVGGAPKVKLHTLEVLGAVTEDEVREMDDKREHDITSRLTSYAQNKLKDDQIRLQNDQIKSLENKLKSRFT